MTGRTMESQKCAAPPSGYMPPDEGKNAGGNEWRQGCHEPGGSLYFPVFRISAMQGACPGWKAARLHDGVYGGRDRCFRNVLFPWPAGCRERFRRGGGWRHL
ncbi:hypothetical protein HMPREF3039_02477 [Akkermansia sp. KLE1798]|nr:hypothetical protein HMPREF3039_02477 [Akkermansia sp. KLE1798]